VNNYPRQILIDLITKYSSTITEDPSKCKALLLDYCGKYQQEVNVLHTALTTKTVQKMLNPSSKLPVKVVLATHTRALVDQVGLSEKAAQWAVESWLLALGIASDKDLFVTMTSEMPNAPSESEAARNNGVIDPRDPSFKNQSGVTTETKQCPFCAEEVKKDAKKCKYCSSDISDDAMAKSYNDSGVEYHNRGNYKQAIADFDKSIGLDPKDAIIYFNRGLAYHQLRNYKQAIADYDKAIGLDPKDAIIYNHRGEAYYQLGNHKQAIADFDKSIGLDPKDAIIYNNRGKSYYILGNYKQAMADYEKAIELDQKNGRIYFNRGDAYTQLGNYQQAIADFDRAVELDPKLEDERKKAVKNIRC